MIRVRLTSSQESALECQGLDHPLDAADALLARSWRGHWIEFAESDRDALASAICEASNLEDEAAQAWDQEGEAHLARLSRGASLSLGNLMAKVGRA